MRLKLTIIILVTMVFYLKSQTIQIQSGTSKDILNAIQTAPINSVVVLPKGVYNFSGQKIQIRKGITITGSGEHETILRKSGNLDWFFQILTNDFVRISNLILDANGFGGGGIQAKATGLVFRLDNSELKYFSTRAIEFHGDITGVIDHNRFEENRITDIVVYGDNDAWNKPIELGSDDAMYVEDNVFIHKKVKGNWHSIASNHGSKYVFRFNSIDDGNFNSNPIDAHGNFEYGRGSRTYEIYGNKIQSVHSYQGIYIRGGTGVIFDNEFIGDFTFPIMLTDYRSFNRDNSGNYISNTYPGLDQIRELYIWNNTYKGNEVYAFVQDRGKVRDNIKENRDFYYTARPGYKPFTYPHPMTQSHLKADNKNVQDPEKKVQTQLIPK